MSTQTRDRILYRSGHLDDVTVSGLEKMRELSISTIIDLRSPGEAKALYSKDKPNNENLSGFKIIKLPLGRKGFSIQHCSAKYEKYLEAGSKVGKELGQQEDDSDEQYRPSHRSTSTCFLKDIRLFDKYCCYCATIPVMFSSSTALWEKTELASFSRSSFRWLVSLTTS